MHTIEGQKARKIDDLETAAEWKEASGKNRDRKRMEEELGFFPFAFTCPAGSGDTKAFGWKMIALLVGTINGGLADHWELAGTDPLPPIGTLLDSNRGSYTELCLTRRA
jgi:hypothetical protein